MRLADPQVIEQQGQVIGPDFFLAVLAYFVYYIVLEARFGATVGKLALRLRVVKADSGAPIGWRESVIW